MLQEDEVVVSSSDEKDQSDVPYHLDRIDQRTLPLDRIFKTEGNGTGVEIFVLDSGINYNHDEFEGRATYAGYDVIDSTRVWGGERRGRDCIGHGTLVASIAAGKTNGVAPGASLKSVRVLSCSKHGSVVNTIKGLDYIIALKKKNPQRKIVVVCALLAYYVRKDLNSEVEEAALAGIPMVVAAGNYRRDACHFSPAASPYAIVVGGSNYRDGLYDRTNFGKCVDIFAPGVDVRGAGFPCLDCTVHSSGTSYAAPAVAGVVALMMEKDGYLSPSQIKSQLVKTCSRNFLNFDGIPLEHRLDTPNCLVYAPQIPSYLLSLRVDANELQSLLYNHSRRGYLPMYISTSQNYTLKGLQGVNIIFKRTPTAKNAIFHCVRSIWAIRRLVENSEVRGYTVSTFRSFILEGKKLRFIVVLRPVKDVGYSTQLHARTKLDVLQERLKEMRGISTPVIISTVYCERIRPIVAILGAKSTGSAGALQNTDVNSTVPAKYALVHSVGIRNVDKVIAQYLKRGYFLKDIDSYGSCHGSTPVSILKHMLLFHPMVKSLAKYELYKLSEQEVVDKMGDLVSQGKEPIMISQVGEKYLLQFKLTY
jgi:hypothetical protein